MVVRIAGYGYQKGFGGHFHNDNSIAALRDIPGVVIASPARPDDAAAMLRTCVAAATAAGSLCVFLEPIALYHTRDLHDDGDGGWLAAVSAAAGGTCPIGRARTYGDGTISRCVTFGNGLRMSLRAAAASPRRGSARRILDLRWLAPLPVEDMLREAARPGRVLIVDETRRTGGVGEGVFAAFIERASPGRARVASKDSFVPLGDGRRRGAARRAHDREDRRRPGAGRLTPGSSGAAASVPDKRQLKYTGRPGCWPHRASQRLHHKREELAMLPNMQPQQPLLVTQRRRDLSAAWPSRSCSSLGPRSCPGDGRG